MEKSFERMARNMNRAYDGENDDDDFYDDNFDENENL
jgi:hypothetical protein